MCLLLHNNSMDRSVFFSSYFFPHKSQGLTHKKKYFYFICLSMDWPNQIKFNQTKPNSIRPSHQTIQTQSNYSKLKQTKANLTKPKQLWPNQTKLSTITQIVIKCLINFFHQFKLNELQRWDKVSLWIFEVVVDSQWEFSMTSNICTLTSSHHCTHSEIYFYNRIFD